MEDVPYNATGDGFIESTLSEMSEVSWRAPRSPLSPLLDRIASLDPNTLARVRHSLESRATSLCRVSGGSGGGGGGLNREEI